MSKEFEGVKIFKAQGLLNRTEQNTDAVMGLVVYLPAFPAGLNANDIVEAIQLSDIEAVGLDAAFDANNNILLHYHVEEFFRLAPEGKLIVIPTDQGTADEFFALPSASAAFKLYSDVKRIGYVYNTDDAGLDIADELANCQAFIEAMRTDHYLIDGIYLEGRNIGTAGVDNRLQNAPNCHVVNAQDLAIAEIDAAYANYAAVGSVLGMRAVRNPSEHLGSVDVILKPDGRRGDQTYSLTDDALGRWQRPALSDGTAFETLTGAQKDALTDKAYIYAGMYPNFDGVYFNGEPTCVDITSDYAQGENNNIWNMAARGIRKALLPKVKGKVKVDPATGNIRNTSAKYLETIARKPLLKMVADDLISGQTLQIPTNQSPSDQVPLKVNATVTKDRIVHLFEVTLGIN